jgi:hypothetical protein
MSQRGSKAILHIAVHCLPLLWLTDKDEQLFARHPINF